MGMGHFYIYFLEMIYLSFLGFLSLAAYLCAMRWRHGTPEMVSSTYYQGGGIWFTVVMWIVGISMMICTLGSGIGIQALAFLGCGGLMFVGAAPKFLDDDERSVHKGGAIVSAVGCVGWCLSANYVPTLVIASLYLLHLIRTYVVRVANKNYNGYVWLFAELAGFLDTFITYWSLFY